MTRLRTHPLPQGGTDFMTRDCVLFSRNREYLAQEVRRVEAGEITIDCLYLEQP